MDDIIRGSDCSDFGKVKSSKAICLDVITSLMLKNHHLKGVQSLVNLILTEPWEFVKIVLILAKMRIISLLNRRIHDL